MLDGLPIVGITGPSALTLIAFLVITRRLRWYKEVDRELDKTEKERDEWKQIALSVLGLTEKLTVQAEVTNAVIAKADSLPDGERQA